VYVGGVKEWPNYEDIGDHTEGVTVTYDPTMVSYGKLLEFFFGQHNPWTACSSYKQYMSGVWYHNEAQKTAVEAYVADLESKNKRKVGTHRSPLTKLYRAEEYHQQYYSKNRF